eukprot:TRINITY_DN230_c0_g1_i1.p1 TRINITY_DN230_c0_g1~~TRINITY_DN230_c0_g1_i1.p1  ORF type:complete len:489 (+),score=56.69 TRINITY_DN230_c0_g1_i1:10953-12419(+)
MSLLYNLSNSTQFLIIRKSKLIKMKGYVFLLLAHLVLCKFPKNFEFGASTAAFQIEGAWLADNKSMSVWDNLAHSGMIADNSTADIVDNSYYLYQEDIALLKEYGLKNYRMSIAWSRIIPYGSRGSEVNMKAIEHYRKQFQALLAAGITPFVTLYHNDMPINLVIEGEGYTDPDFVADFVNYADVCFRYFGDLVKYWFTFNEPWCLAVLDTFEPHEADIKPYRIGHALLLAHAETVDLYRKKYKDTQRGEIGWVVNSEMYFPKDPKKKEDQEAAKRGLAFQLDWFSDPLFNGDYPKIMRDALGERLPTFTEEQKKKLKGSLDFYALNHYFTFLAEPGSAATGNFWEDRNITTSYDESWNRTDTDWPIVPEGLHGLLTHIQEKWLKGTNLELYITENGAAIKENDIASALDDEVRIGYLQRYLAEVAKAIEEGINITKYFIWSLLDNFEWGSGVSKRFGIVRIEYGENPRRIAKGSMRWYAELIKSFSQ